MSTDETTWGVGELAGATGLTVRTLHHYDEIGLVRPSRRSSAGHRRYTAGDVRRLHRVLALRGFGFALGEIGALLDEGADGPDARELLRRQLDQVVDRITRAQDLRRRIEAVLGRFEAAGEASAAVLVRLIEGMTAVEHTYTPEELERMAAKRREMAERLGPEELAAMAERRRAAWESMTPQQQAEMQRSRPPLPH
ncbi:MerR family transcriptional regulator [Couchioplanes caeruleus]|uniref:MerR family transcriptional regulator n=1 Tax=Couchioplanes caeruleus TaxID=56438 RepID=UPI00201C45CB|nr:MerR family transcriptional regulator [Couchioplanes caeruleus]UQU63881.1 MerR family transcriptional regulator [Couchioplanes caeruleus]